MFNFYQYADYLISVSEQTNQLNKKQLFDWPGVNPENFVHCDNVINAANTSVIDFFMVEFLSLFT